MLCLLLRDYRQYRNTAGCWPLSVSLQVWPRGDDVLHVALSCADSVSQLGCLELHWFRLSAWLPWATLTPSLSLVALSCTDSVSRLGCLERHQLRLSDWLPSAALTPSLSLVAFCPVVSLLFAGCHTSVRHRRGIPRSGYVPRCAVPTSICSHL